MKKWIAVLILGIGLALAGCAQAVAPATQPPIETATEAALTATATEVAVIPTATEEAVTDACVDCHTEKQALIDNAKPEEVAESESEGVG